MNKYRVVDSRSRATVIKACLYSFNYDCGGVVTFYGDKVNGTDNVSYSSDNQVATFLHPISIEKLEDDD